MINDQGMGIPENDQYTIFNVLSTEKDQKQMLLSDGSQMGLGLFISKQIVTKFNGSLDFVSKYEIGSTFFFSFDLESDNEQVQEIPKDNHVEEESG